MSVFSKNKKDGLEESQDRLGGYAPLETGIYTGIIKMAYHSKSRDGAEAINFEISIDGKSYKETVYYTTKEGKNYFLNKDDKTKKVPLPGFTTVDDICLCTTGQDLSEQDDTAEEKVVKIWDREARAELPKSALVLTGLLNQEISLGIMQNLENVSEQVDGKWVDTPKTKVTNNIEKVFNTETRMTVAEARNGKTEAEFWDSWEKRNKGNQRDKRTIKDGGSAGNAGRPGASNTGAPKDSGSDAPAPSKSLFGKKKDA